MGEAQKKEKADSAGEAKTATPFLLGEGLPPIPSKPVDKIQKGDFVDMAGLLQDNIEFGEEAQQGGWRQHFHWTTVPQSA